MQSIVLGILLFFTVAVLPAHAALPVLERGDFNRLSAESDAGIFWEKDDHNPGVLDPDELVVLGSGADRSLYLKNGRLSPAYDAIYRKLVELKRREVVRSELDQGFPTLVRSDFSQASKAEREFVRRIAKVVKQIDELFAKQRGADVYASQLSKMDVESRALFARNQGPWCEAPKTENNPFCNALPGFPGRRWYAYPNEDVQNADYCKKLAKLPNGKQLMAPFTVVRKDKSGVYVSEPITRAYAKEMKTVAAELRAAARAIASDQERVLEAYLLAAAKAFEDGSWEQADEAWAKMNAANSAWYLRVAPDEVYWDVCQEKAGFHVSFARINKKSLELQKQLMPLRNEMETSLARLTDGAYQPRSVNFQMPDFIDIVLNAGDSRSALGATAGQSLPNFGKVAEEGRGRTVVMTNLYQDPDSKRMDREKAASVLSSKSLAFFTDDPMPNLFDVVLHEATHNLGPHSDYKIGGRGPSQVFGGPLASTLEELKAQTGTLFYIHLLLRKGIISEELARQIYTRALTWAFGKISQGMFEASGIPKTYGQLAAVQVGFLMEEGALSWDEGKRFVIHFEKLPEAAEKLLKKVATFKAKGEAEDAAAFVASYVSGDKSSLTHRDELQERLLKYPRGTLLYSVSF